jgi:hypothetical protein
MPTSEAPSGSVQELAIELTLGVVTPKNHPPSRVLGSLKDSVVEAVEKIATEDTLQRNPALAEPYSNPTTLSRRVTARLSSLHKRKIWTPGPARGDDHSQWGINWYMPTYMVLLGVGGACGVSQLHNYKKNMLNRITGSRPPLS